MKLIAASSGFIAVRYPIEDVLPDDRPPRPKLVEAILARYRFVGRNDPNQMPAIFQNGAALVDKREIAFNEMQVFTGETMCQASNTDDAELIAFDFFDFLDATFGYKFGKTPKSVKFISAVIVEFDGKLNNVISTTHFLEKLINEACPGQRNLKRLSFGFQDNMAVSEQPVTPFDAASKAEFFIERRLGSDPAINRFFCSAPLEFKDHLAVLEQIEQVTASSGAYSPVPQSPPPGRRRMR